MVGKRHASDEITAKMAQANELAAKGKTQREISKALGVSIMTYHRWKKMVSSGEIAAADTGRDIEVRPETLDNLSSAEKIRRLELENARLRQLFTDMVLEKLSLEEELRSRQEPRRRRPDSG
jgi:putative transposase